MSQRYPKRHPKSIKNRPWTLQGPPKTSKGHPRVLKHGPTPDFSKKTSFQSLPKKKNSSQINKIRTWMDSKSPLCNAIQTDTPASKRSASNPYSEQASKFTGQRASKPASQQASKPASHQPAADITEGAGGRGEALR